MEALARTYTWTDYLELPDDERWEIVGGQLFGMSPSPSRRHQEISMNLSMQIPPKLRQGPCRLYAAPMDLKLSETDIVQPDLFLVCDPNQLKPGHIEGPPSLIVEILSPSSVAHDRVRKLPLYARAGVKEYWMIDPASGILEILLLKAETYTVALTCSRDDTFQSPSFPDWEIDLEELFPED